MNIALICAEFPPDATGGGAIVYESLASEYQRLGHRVTVFAGDYTGERREEGTARAFGLRRYPLVPTPKRFPFLKSVLPPTLPAVRRLYRDLRRERIDVAHLHGYSLAFVDIASWLLPANIRQIFTIHGLPTSASSKPFPIPLGYAAYVKLSTYATMRRATRITTLSRELSQTVRALGFENDVIGNGLDVAAWPLRHVDSGGPPVLLCVGRLAHDKGFADLIAAVPALRAEFPDLTVRIVGEDFGAEKTLRQRARDLAADNVVFLGRLTKPGVQDEMERATALVMPSHDEPFGLVALEAMATGLPIVASRAGALPEIVRDGIDGVLFAPRDVAGMTRSIAALLGRPDRQAELSRNAHDRAATFTWQACAAAYLALMR